MIKVCDAIMGSGKTQAAITYMNEHPDQRFVYVTPFLDETERIRRSCPLLNFILPNQDHPKAGGTKVGHARWLLGEGKNIATTHASFRTYTEEMLQAITKYGYTIIVDEALEMFDQSVESESDIELAERGGYVVCEDDVYHVTDNDNYTGGKLKSTFELFRSQNLIQVKDVHAKGEIERKYFCWSLSAKLLSTFREAIVLTYLFQSSDMRCFMDMNGLEYQYIYVTKEGDRYSFTDTPGYWPEYVTHLKDMLHVLDIPAINKIGDEKNALSSTWYDHNKKRWEEVGNCLRTFSEYYHKTTSSDFIWSVYKKDNIVNAVSNGRKRRRCISFNCRATNKYRSCTTLAYLVNLYENPMLVNYFTSHGCDYNQDAYALSNMVQWIWRSAIRDGKEIYLYLPSRRMREILFNWMDEVTEAATGLTSRAERTKDK